MTPKGNRLHIGIFGRTNSGKSSLINAITGQETALVSDIAGTTTDPVYKAMEIKGLGAVMLIDTAGFSDSTELGELRARATRKAADKADIAVLVVSDEQDFKEEKEWLSRFKSLNTPCIAVYNAKSDDYSAAQRIEKSLGISVHTVNAQSGYGVDELRTRIAEFRREEDKITDRVCKSGDTVLLVMPQDAGAPTGRLILPQVNVIRELLDKGCNALCVTPATLKSALESLKNLPDLVITDSQVFREVYDILPKGCPLTSFSVLFADYKGDIDVFVEGAKALDTLDAQSNVLIAEACTHAPQSEDIGRVKIPAMLNKKYGVTNVTVVAGDGFPDDLKKYRLIIHCGACMFNKKHVLTRIAAAVEQGVPITNYGICIAKLQGILDKVLIK